MQALLFVMLNKRLLFGMRIANGTNNRLTLTESYRSPSSCANEIFSGRVALDIGEGDTKAWWFGVSYDFRN